MESVVENSMVIAGISTKIEDPAQASQQIAALWEQFWKDNLPAQITNRSNNTIYTIYHQYAGDHHQPYTATIGYRINKIEDLPACFKFVIIPQQHYLVFTASGTLPEAVLKTWKKIWQANLQRSYTFDFEIYDERAQNPQDAIVDIYVAVAE